MAMNKLVQISGGTWIASQMLKFSTVIRIWLSSYDIWAKFVGWGVGQRKSMKKPVLRSSTVVVALVLALTVAPGLRRAAGNQSPQAQGRVTNTVSRSEISALASSLVVPRLAPTRKHNSPLVPTGTIVYRLAPSPTFTFIIPKISGEPQLLVLFGTALISLAFLLRSWSTSG
jgi:hypothetical protein